LAVELIQTIRRRKVILQQVGACFEQHPDQEILASLPGAGDFLAPALLIKFGDDRQRFPSASSVQARASRQQSVWANAYGLKVRPGCGSDRHAHRCLANRWLSIIWKLWQTNQTYKEAYHLQQRAQRAKARS
jgi:hypothetical protein